MRVQADLDRQGIFDRKTKLIYNDGALLFLHPFWRCYETFNEGALQCDGTL